METATIPGPSPGSNPTKLYRLSGGFARREKLPVYFVGRVVGETRKAYKMFGRGTIETRTANICSCCGRTLTHPVSVILGIGPECGGHWWDWATIGGYTAENLEKVRGLIHNVTVDGWIPKACVIETHETEERVQVPESVEWTGTLNRDRPPRKAEDIVDSKGPRRSDRKAQFAGTAVNIFFPYSKEDVERVRMLEGRRFVPDDPKHWTCLFTADNVERLEEWGFLLDIPLQDFLKAARAQRALEPNPEDIKFDPSVMRGELFPFQIEAVEFIERLRGRALLGDQMGLGKTIVALAYVASHPKLRPAVVVCPAAVKLNWAREARKWIREDVTIVVLEGTQPYEFDRSADIFVINYDILPHWVETLRELKPKVIIGDEIHYIKSNKAKRTKAMKMLAKGVRHVIPMSGTPALNRPVELYNVLKMIDWNLIPDWPEFIHEFCAARMTRFGMDVSGASNLDKFHKILKRVMIRRLKADVLTELPDKLFSVVPMQMTNTTEYAEAILQFRRWQDEMADFKKNNDPRARAEALVRIEKLKQVCLRGKLPQAIDWIRDSLDSNGKLVVFTTHDLAVQTLRKEFIECCVVVDGSVTGESRQGAVDLFQENEKIKLFIGNIKAAGVGITLTASSKVAFLEFPWTPGDLDQATDRCHRIGQHDSVNVYYLVAEGTIEDNIIKLLDRKRKIIDKLIDGKNTDEGSLFSELLEEIRAGG